MLHRLAIGHLRQGMERFFVRRPVRPSFPAGPLKELPFQQAGYREGKVRLPPFDLFRAEHLEKDAQGLLDDIGAGEVRLVFCDAANRSVQHRDKSQNQQHLDQLRTRVAHSEQFPVEIVRRGICLGDLQMRQKLKWRAKCAEAVCSRS